jgi:hypothetical protein
MPEGKDMHNTNKERLENDCKEILNAFDGVLSWKWDDRFETLLAEFGVDNKDRVLAILDQYLKIKWNNSNIRNAPDVVKKINVNLGKLRSGQLLFTSDPKQDVFIYCAWWPWSDGKTISIRIAPTYKKLLHSEKVGKIQSIKDWLGIK